jgi:hypothetical protein
MNDETYRGSPIPVTVTDDSLELIGLYGLRLPSRSASLCSCGEVGGGLPVGGLLVVRTGGFN